MTTIKVNSSNKTLATKTFSFGGYEITINPNKRLVTFAYDLTAKIYTFEKFKEFSDLFTLGGFYGSNVHGETVFTEEYFINTLTYTFKSLGYIICIDADQDQLVTINNTDGFVKDLHPILHYFKSCYERGIS